MSRVARLALVGLCALALSACERKWETSYNQNPTPEQSAAWRLNAVSVDVPRTLTVSEADNFSAADGDIVWRGEPPGDRYIQVQRIMQEAVETGAATLSSHGRPVNVNVTVNQFHALTEMARARLTVSGVHNINFDIAVVDARTGAVLASEAGVSADLVAFSGQDAVRAEAAGQSQRVRIVSHVSNVVAGWLGTGPDVRQTFSRIGT
ncbi:hypothetical protein RA29_21095 [Tateyamaria sp. ANG-S1]|nr:hypothetical protein RA29_21095 [Tateyamaria sp. ANG-S1]